MRQAPAKGNGKARESLILSQMPLAAGLAEREHRKLPPWIELAEARQVAYLALVQAVDRWDASRGVPLGAWIRKPVAGAVRDLGRRKPARLTWVPQGVPRMFLSDETPDWSANRATYRADSAPSPESLMAYEEFRAAVWRRVDALPVRLRLVVRLRYCAGLGFGEIARLMRRPVKANTVEAWKERAVKRLREQV
ncbi:MAG: sigma-70 family RNA polymerase sigma factor [Planctomycetota bacterium]